ncbi:sulfite exporter TauE/SafE family protein [Sphingomonas paeninsulae]|uniref:Probable membrane transporter protein n=1 Tax=Sphingomonas paeninsulae TaxID=2319844 RepID=A0A494TFI2_SPHPE|nr:sulfite exporter TauE/SafE family protein [Sphingomonas paeninsulae]AYJ88080.1 sulfite exporter TauE/SafE family protein [Sphingomonas paeninsulae]
MDYNPFYSLAGFFVGILVGLTGVGGGSLMTPLLVLLFNFHPATAVGTDLLYASVTKTVGTVVHGRRGTVDWQIVRRLASGSVPATILTLLVLAYEGTPGPKTAGVITAVLGAALVATAFAILFRPRILAWAGPRLEGISNRDTMRWTVLLGVALGVLVSISSVGAGALGVTALLILYPTAPINRIAGSDIAHAVPLTLIAGLGHWYIGSVNFSLLGSLLIGSIPGVILGSMLGSRAPDWVLRPVLALVLLIVGVKLLT